MCHKESTWASPSMDRESQNLSELAKLELKYEMRQME